MAQYTSTELIGLTDAELEAVAGGNPTCIVSADGNATLTNSFNNACNVSVANSFNGSFNGSGNGTGNTISITF